MNLADDLDSDVRDMIVAFALEMEAEYAQQWQEFRSKGVIKVWRGRKVKMYRTIAFEFISRDDLVECADVQEDRDVVDSISSGAIIFCAGYWSGGYSSTALIPVDFFKGIFPTDEAEWNFGPSMHMLRIPSSENAEDTTARIRSVLTSSGFLDRSNR